MSWVDYNYYLVTSDQLDCAYKLVFDSYWLVDKEFELGEADDVVEVEKGRKEVPSLAGDRCCQLFDLTMMLVVAFVSSHSTSNESHFLYEAVSQALLCAAVNLMTRDGYRYHGSCCCC